MTKIKNDFEKFIETFKKIRKMGKIKSRRSGDTGVGKTLEDILGVEENNFELPDLYGFEVKSMRQITSSKLTLFTKAPSPKGSNNKLREKYGSIDEAFSELRVLHTTLSIDWNTHSKGENSYSYCMRLDNKNKRIDILVKDLDSGNILEDGDVYLPYQSIEDKIETKIKNLAFIKTNSEVINEMEYFEFNSCTLYSGLKFEKFLQYVAEGLIVYEFRIGSYKNKSKKNYGKIHDHGSGFRINPKDLDKLYENKIEI